MIKLRHGNLLHPAVVYLMLLAVVILLSWIGGIYGMRGATRGGGPVLRSLLDVQGIRWMIRHSASAIAAAPVGNAMLLLSAAGVVCRSGIMVLLPGIRHGNTLSYKQRSALSVSSVLFLLILAAVVWGIAGRGHVLLSLTGEVGGGPLPDGIAFLLFVLIAIPSVVYGYVAGQLRDLNDVIRAMTCLYGRYSSFFLTLLVASQLVAACGYSGLSNLIGHGGTAWNIIRFVLWWLPLPLIALGERRVRTCS